MLDIVKDYFLVNLVLDSIKRHILVINVVKNQYQLEIKANVNHVHKMNIRIKRTINVLNVHLAKYTMFKINNVKDVQLEIIMINKQRNVDFVLKDIIMMNQIKQNVRNVQMDSTETV